MPRRHRHVGSLRRRPCDLATPRQTRNEKEWKREERSRHRKESQKEGETTASPASITVYLQSLHQRLPFKNWSVQPLTQLQIKMDTTPSSLVDGRDLDTNKHPSPNSFWKELNFAFHRLLVNKINRRYKPKIRLYTVIVFDFNSILKYSTHITNIDIRGWVKK